MTKQKRKTVLMLVLYALFFLFVMLLQDAVLGKYTPWGVKFFLAPMAAYCVAVQTGAENGGIFCLAAGLCWAFCGADDGGGLVFLMTFCGAVCGYLCTAYFHPRLLPSVLLTVLAAGATLLILYGVRIYMEGLHAAALIPMLKQLALSLPFSPLFYWVCKAVRKVGL